MRSEYSKLLTFLLVASLLQACGGGGGDGGSDDGTTDTNNDSNNISNTTQDYSGETGQAIVTNDNSKQLANAGASGTRNAIDSDSVPLVAARSDSPVSRDEILKENDGLIMSILRGDYTNHAARGATAARTQDLTSVLCDSGSIIATYPDSGSTSSWSIDYNQCTRSTSYAGSTVSTRFNGTVVGTFTQVGNGFRYEYSYENFTVAIETPLYNHSQTFNMSMTCATDENGANYSCDYYSDDEGYDGRIYRVTDVDVSGNESSGYNVYVRVYDPDNGYVTVTTEIPVTYNCSGGYPDAGRILVEGANEKIVTVEFTSCSAYVVVFDGVANTYSWP